MGRFQEGGVHTQKVKAVYVTLMAMALVFAAGAIVFTDESDAANATVKIDKHVVATEGEVKATIMFQETAAYTSLGVTYDAKVTDGKGEAQSDAVSPSTGSLGNGEEVKLTVKAPKTAGKYKLTVVFTATVDEKKQDPITKDVIFKVVVPVKLSITMKNESNTDLKGFLVDFYVDGNVVTDKPVEVTVLAGSEGTVSYDYAGDLGSGAHTFKAKASDKTLVGDKIVGLDKEHSFYVGQSDYSLIMILMGIFLVIIIVIAIYVYRKPVKNYGKPKARR